MYDVITVGSNTVDVFAHTDRSQVINIQSKDRNEEFISYPVGGKLLITELLMNFGGNGANTAVCFSRMGFKTGYVGEVGRDTNGKLIMANLKKEKISFLGSRGDKDSKSGYSIILDAMEDDRTILVYKGCNNDMHTSELKLSRLKASWFYISSMLGSSLKTMVDIADHAKQRKIRIAFNPSATMLENESQAAMKFIRYADILVLNKEEAEGLVGKESVEVNLLKLSGLGPKTVVITDGKRGSTSLYGGYYYKIAPRKDLKVVETTGAGDAFASTLTAGIMMRKPFEHCLKMAVNNSEAVISGHGAQKRLLTRKEMAAAVAKDKRSIEKRKAPC
jgi:ribokinase